MLPLHPLHSLAAHRGDGLHPRLLELMQRPCPALSNTGPVVDLAQRRGDRHIQSGPNPARPAGSVLAPGILPFTAPGTQSERQTRHPQTATS